MLPCCHPRAAIHFAFPPFFSLSCSYTVGVDNMFIISAALQQQPASHPLPHRVGLALAAVGPSITLAGKHLASGWGMQAALCLFVTPSPLLPCVPSSQRDWLAYQCSPPSTPLHPPAASCEVVAFALGGLTSMPALRNFSGAGGPPLRACSCS